MRGRKRMKIHSQCRTPKRGLTIYVTFEALCDVLGIDRCFVSGIRVQGQCDALHITLSPLAKNTTIEFMGTEYEAPQVVEGQEYPMIMARLDKVKWTEK